MGVQCLMVCIKVPIKVCMLFTCYVREVRAHMIHGLHFCSFNECSVTLSMA